MKTNFSILKKIVLFCLIILSFVVVYVFFYYNQHYSWYSFDVQVNWMITVFYFIFFFYTFIFLIDFKYFYLVFGFIMILGALLWIVTYLLEIFNAEISSWTISIIQDIATILSFSILSPGLTINVIKFIKNNSNQDKKRNIFQKYHIHEGFVGILFFIIAFFLMIICYLLIQYEIIRKQLRIFLALDVVFLFLFLFSGSFLIFRDWNDVIKFKFIEIRDKQSNNHSSSVFNPITPNSIQFFRSPSILWYPLGILLNSISVSMLIHGTDFLPTPIFRLNYGTILFIGFIIGFISGAMIGFDWYRLFAKIYPDLYQEIELVLNDLKNNN